MNRRKKLLRLHVGFVASIGFVSFLLASQAVAQHP